MDISEEIAKVSSDGEPHEVLTLIAVSAGFLAAIAILIVLRINLSTSHQRDTRERRRISLFGVRRSLEITRKPEIYTIEQHSGCLETKITIDENEKYLYIPGITTIAM
uniref:Uncharacterized protein n=2 Tax=Lutzomyia longipalpis TaxID=7200 RepID=A0A1B0CJB7_LUTLO